MTEVSYPVFRLGWKKPEIFGNRIQYTERIEDPDTGEIRVFIHVVDDKNQPGTTLAQRRISLMRQGIKLKKIARAVFFLADLIKIATATTWFIDSNGTLFNYKKTKSYPLVFKKIEKIIPLKAGGTIIEVEGIPNRFKSMYPPIEGQTYAGLLVYENSSYLLYGFYDQEYDKTRRSV